VELANILGELWRRKVFVVVAVLIAVVAGTSVAYQIKLDPPGLKSKASLPLGASSTQVLFDSKYSSLVNLNSQQLLGLVARASIFSEFMTSGPMQSAIARRVGIPVGRLASQGPYAGATNASTGGQPPAGVRASQLATESTPYRLLFDGTAAANGLPLINIDATAPSSAMAVRLANAAVSALKSYVGTQEAQSRTPAFARLKVIPLGAALGGLTNPGVNLKVALLVGIGTLIALCVLIVVCSGAIRNIRLRRAEAGDGETVDLTVERELLRNGDVSEERTAELLETAQLAREQHGRR
jgi:hypothetical protein